MPLFMRSTDHREDDANALPAVEMEPPHGATLARLKKHCMLPVMNPLHATIEEFAADGYRHVQCYCPRCRMMRLRPISRLPCISKDLNSPA